MVENPPANAVDSGHRFSPWLRKMPRGAEQQSPCAPTTEPVPQSPETRTRGTLEPWSLGSATRGAAAMGSPGTATRESPLSQKTQYSHKEREKAI